MTLRAVNCVVLAIALCALGPACSRADAALEATALTDGGASPPADATAVAVGAPAALVAGGINCGSPDVPPHGTVRAPRFRFGAIALYACSDGYALVGQATRTCQSDGTWSGTTPACSFAAAGSNCGSCGGTYDASGTCSVTTPPNLGAPCDLGPGQGACANGGIIACGGTCQPADPAIGDPTPWHIFPAPNGSWDWDCDGTTTMNFVPSSAPPECSTYADTDACNGAPAVEYLTDLSPCGEQATLFKRDCDWKTIGPTCLDTPAAHRVVFQGCR